MPQLCRIMNAKDFITKVKNEGKTLTLWYGTHSNWDERTRDTSSNSNYDERITGFYEDREEAWDVIKAKASEHQAEFGEFDDFDINKAEVSPDDLEGIDWEEVEEWDNFDDDQLYELITEQNCTEWDDLVEQVSFAYPSVQGALLVIWGWERYVGYSRMIHEIRYGMYGEDESMCCPIDNTYSPQASVIATAADLEGLSKAETYSLIETKLFEEGDWRWTSQARGCIRSYLSDLKEAAKGEQEYALLQYAANACDGASVAKSFDKMERDEFTACLAAFQKEYLAVPVDAEGPNEEQDEQLNNIVEKYMEELNDIPY